MRIKAAAVARGYCADVFFSMSSPTSLLARFNAHCQAHTAGPGHARLVLKRDGSTVAWDASKITRAVALAFYDVNSQGGANPPESAPDGSRPPRHREKARRAAK